MLALRFSSLAPMLAAVGACALIGLPFAAQSGSTEPAYLGVVDRIQGEARLVRDTNIVLVKRGHTVAGGDTLRTGADSRVRILFSDGTRLTLGESAEAFIADFVYNPIKKSGAAILDILKGAFRYTSGEMGRLSDKRIRVRTSTATASTTSTRGFDIWGGPIDDSYGLLLLTGEVIEVRNDGGMVVLDKKRLGSRIPGRTVAPDKPVTWDKEKVTKAIATIAFK
jgi:hypothetical protein